MRIYLPDEAATLSLGAQLFESHGPGNTLFLRGTLGAGKTTLVRGLLRAAGYTGPVKSPTFTLVEEYRLATITIYHFDLYRLASPDELEWFGFRDYLMNDALCVIEWPERGMGELPEPQITISLQLELPGRTAIIESPQPLGHEWLTTWASEHSAERPDT